MPKAGLKASVVGSCRNGRPDFKKILKKKKEKKRKRKNQLKKKSAAARPVHRSITSRE